MWVSATSYSASLATIASELTQIASELTQVVQELEQSMPASQAMEGAENVEQAPTTASTVPTTATAPTTATVPTTAAAPATTPVSTVPTTATAPTTAPASTSAPAAPTTPAAPATTAQGTGGATKLRIASFNVLGDSHTGTKGDQHPTWQMGTQRTPRMIGYLKSENVDVAGLQEFDPSQQKEFKNEKSGYSMYATKGSNDGIVWNSSKFTAVKKQSIPIKYYSDKTAHVPAVQLKDKQTGKTFWVISVHNPSEGYQKGTQPERTKDMQIEQQAMQQLNAGGTPVYLVGDLNEKGDATKAVTGGTKIKHAGGSTDSKHIDHIYGLGSNVSFSDYSANSAPEKTQTSDHPIVVATTTIS